MRLVATRKSESGEREADWRDCLVHPASVESGFCAVRGSGEGDRPLLERLAGLICKAIEASGAQELMVESLALTTAYIPVIITNAGLRAVQTLTRSM